MKIVIPEYCGMIRTPRRIVWIVMFVLAALPALAQDKQVVQIKTFDQQLQPFPNIEVSINGNEFISVGKKGVAIAELSEGDLPIRTIHIRNEQLEAASWIYSKGVVEITVRKKSYQMVTVSVRNTENQPIRRVKVNFKGKNPFAGVTGEDGKLQIPLALEEGISSVNQIEIADFRVKGITAMNNEQIIIAEKIVAPSPLPDIQGPSDTEEAASKEYFKDFDLKSLDSIQSLTVFYSIFKNYQIKNMDEATKRRVDAKFDELVRELGDPMRKPGSSLIGGITDSTFLEDDIRALIGQVRGESQTLTEQRAGFDEKIRIINSKLEGGISNLSEERRTQLLSDLALLERLLIENESRFFKNQNDYRLIINGIKEKYFDFKDLEDKLSVSEAQRLEEQRIFRQRLLAISAVVLVFASLLVLLIYVSNALRKQKQALAKANGEISRINENLEELVFERTRLLEEAHRELDTFLYRASHDMRSPVCSIIGLCNIASLLSQGEPKELIDRVVSTTVGMDKLLKKLSSISEINQPTNFSSVQLLAMLEEVREDFAGLLPLEKVDFTVTCPPDLEIKSYPSLVYTILFNLVENSLYYGSLDNKRELVVRVEAHLKGDEVEISVYDNGMGVDPSIHHRLFDMFFKGTEKSRGHGLGLYIVSKAIQALSGRIEVESEVGSYTKFRLVIPRDLEQVSEENVLQLEGAAEAQMERL